jgi:ADP-ribose pyrophosphatase YjhB (NUDIX family)
MRRRRAARVLLLNEAGEILLFRFVHRRGALAGYSYWATPGGEVEADETYEAAAIRELREETGMVIHGVGGEICRRSFPLQLADGERVIAEERFFRVQAPHSRLSREGWTPLEIEVMAEHRWWSQDDLANTQDLVFPEGLLDILRGLAAKH